MAADGSASDRLAQARAPEFLVGTTQTLNELLAQLRAQPTRRQLRPFDVVINGTQAGHALVLEAEGLLYADRETLRGWRIARDPGTRLSHADQVWFALRDIPGYRHQIDEETLTLELSFSATAFLSTDLGVGSSRAALSPVEPVTSVAYDLSANHVRRAESTQSTVAGFIELAHANRWGHWSSSWVASAQQIQTPFTEPGVPTDRVSWRRLETAYTRLFVDRATSLRVGDTLSRASATGSSFYYAGLQWVSSADLLPGLSRQAAPFLAGTADAPGSLQVFVNGVLRQTARVPAGPFSINQLPAVDGEGNVRLVVTDVLGRETVINQRLYNYAGLLPVGRQQWAVDAGWIRSLQLLGAAPDYGDPMVTGFWRRGLHDRLTVEGRLSAAPGYQAQAVSATMALPWRTAATLSMGQSQSDAGLRGHEQALELIHRSGPFSWAFRASQATPEFRALANRSLRLPRQTVTTTLGYDTAQWGSGSLNVSEIQTADGLRQTLAGYNHALRLGRWAFLSLSVNHIRASTASPGSTGAFLGLSVPLGARTTVLSQFGQGGGGESQFLSVQRAPAQSPGAFWQGTLRQQAGLWQAQGSVFVETPKALLNVEASHSEAASALRGGVRGALVWMGGTFGALRASQGGYALVRAEGLSGVGVLRDGQRVARTDARGRALVGGLVPYIANRLQLQADELPLEVEIDNLEHTVVPADRSGAVAVFTVRQGRPALLQIVLEDGGPAPAGAELRVLGRDELFFVARKGEAYVSGLAEQHTVQLQWSGQQCRFELRLPAVSEASVARVGPLICRGVKR